MRFLLDMGISQGVAHWLRNQGHDSVHLNDEGLFKLPDNDILAKDVTEKRIIVTTDIDFGQLLAFNNSVKLQLFNSGHQFSPLLSLGKSLNYYLKNFSINLKEIL